MHSPTIIGITGNIGTGKSTVAAMLGELGADVIDADKVAHETMQAGTAVHARIVDTFGTKVLRDDGDVDRSKLGAVVFANPSALAQLEAIVHPPTLAAIRRRIADSPSRIIVVEAIKLIESGMADSCDRIWVTTCPPEEQIRRLVRGRGMSYEAAAQRVHAQPPQDMKISRADVVIDTSGPMLQTRKQVEDAWDRLVFRDDSIRRTRGKPIQP